jgi:hypothetical protein
MMTTTLTLIQVVSAVTSVTLLVLYPAVFRRILQSLWALSYAIEGFTGSFRSHQNDNLAAPAVKTDRKLVTVAKQNSAQLVALRDVEDGLVGQGMSRAKAKLAAQNAGELNPGVADFSILFKSAITGQKVA